MLRAVHTLCVVLVATAGISASASGEVRSLLHEQALSHIAFHSDAFKVGLARLAVGSDDAGTSTGAAGGLAVIVGVEWGRDVYALADAGFRVVAVEPDVKYAAAIQEHAPEVRVIEAYAGEKGTGNGTIALDDVLPDSEGEIAVLSADVQGGEDKVLNGAEQLLISGRVRTLWVESIACQASALHVLHLLDRHGYELYDFVPWGRPKSHPEDGTVPRSRASFAYYPNRPSTIDKYWQWLCDTQRAQIGDTPFRWLQTDIIAIRKDLHSDEMMKNLAALVNLCYGQADPATAAECQLRKHLASETRETKNTKETKDEL